MNRHMYQLIYRSRSPRRYAVGFLCVLFLSTPAAALTPAVLIDPDLHEQPITVVGYADGTLTYFGEDRVQQRTKVGEIVRLDEIGLEEQKYSEPSLDGIPVSRMDDAEAFVEEQRIKAEQTRDRLTAPVAELVDGQRFAGELLGGTADGQAIRWRHPLLGELTLPLEMLHRFEQIMVDPPTPTQGTQDAVRLTNGDVLAGFVAATTEAGLSLEVAGTQEAVVLPWDRVAGVTLANPMQPPSSEGDFLKLVDRTRVRLTDWVWGRDELTGRLVGEEARAIALPIDTVRQIDFTSTSSHLVELAALPSRITAGGDVYGLTIPPRRDDDRLLLHAPVTVELTLPAGAKRFAAHASIQLPAGIPIDRARLAGCELILISQGRELGRWPLGWQTSAQINVELPAEAESLTLQLDPSPHGPVLDRVKLASAVVLVREGVDE